MSLHGATLGPGELLDRFEVEGVVGRGGMATVYRVRHVHLHTLHALKVLDVSSEDEHQRLLQEGRTQAALRHPNVVAVTDVVPVGRALGLVMDLVQGPDLRLWLNDRLAPLDEVDALAEGLFAGVAAAHGAGVVHRDLKPGNILLDPSGGRIVPRITDFGLAKLLDAGARSVLTRSGITLGTPAYMAPEQIGGSSRVDHRADLFALGAVLYELTTGHPAFEGDDLVSLLSAVSQGRHRPVQEVRPEVPPRLRAALEGALQTDPDARWPDVEAFRDAWRGGRGAPAPLDWPPDVVARATTLRRDVPTGPVSSDTLAGFVPADHPVTHPTAAPVSLGAPRAGGGLLPALVLGASLLGAAAIVAVALRGPGAEPVPAAAPVAPVVPADEVAAGVATRPVEVPSPGEPADHGEDPEEAPPAPAAPARPAAVARPVAATPAAGGGTGSRPSPRPVPAAVDDPPAEAPVAEEGPAEVAPPGGVEVDVPSPARVEVEGDALEVVAYDQAGRLHPLGALSPGAYTLRARFGADEAPVPVLQLELAGGEALVVRCRSALRRCLLQAR
ncbi:MAG: protein kinase [Alphaproteobacteria bacterium]|nr:protein kinase [Alphaproteobacteria bacterium]